MSSPPVAPHRVCANGHGRFRQVRARGMPAGFLVLAASIFFLASAGPAGGQFPIKQLPGKSSGFGVQGSGGSGEGTGDRGQGKGAAVTGSQPLPAVARISVVEKDGISYGSGTLVDVRGDFGLVVSNWHVVRDAAGPITVEFPDGFKSPAEVVKTDKDWDLAALSIYRPQAKPVAITAAAPQLGEPLTIAGYGNGDWRMASGRCTQYLAPGVEFPHELVELAAEARQGDSGGPIFNQRGELAGVLFGSGPGYTSGSYGGRVLKFLATVVPDGTPSSHGPAPNSSPADGRPPVLDRNAVATAPIISPPPQSTALHEVTPLTPPQPRTDPLLSPPPRRETVDRFGPRTIEGMDDEVDPRVAVVPSRADLSPQPLSAGSFNPAPISPVVPNAPLAPRATPAAGVDLNHAPPEQLLAAVWKHFGGNSVYDQAKTVLALVGVLALVVVFIRFGSKTESERAED